MSEARRLRMVIESSSVGAMPVHRATLRERLSEPTRALVQVRADGIDPGFAGAVDEEMTIAWMRGDAPVRSISLRVRAVRYLGSRNEGNLFELDLRSSFDFLKLTKNTRKFRDQTSKQIIGSVLGGKVGVSFQVTRELWSLPSTIQYKESDFDFVSRLAELDGIYYEATDEDTLGMHDSSSGAEPFRGGLVCPLIPSSGALAHGDETLFALSRATRVGSGRATVNDYHWKTPALNLLKSSKGARDELLEVYDYPSGYRKPEQGEVLSKLRVEALEAEKRTVRGETTFVDLRPNRILTVAHSDGISYGGEYLITEVTHSYEDTGESQGVGRNRFQAIPRATPFRPQLRTPAPEIGGYDTAMVRGPVGEEIHTDVYGRAKVQFHWDREAKGTDEDSRWIRVLQETSSSMTLARVGWEVAVTYVDSDPDRPVAVARMINGQMVPTYAQPAQQNVMTIKTETYPGREGTNEIRIDDTAGAQQIYIFAERDHAIEVQHDKREWVGHDETVTAHLAVSRDVQKTQTVDIGVDVVRTVDGSETHSVNHARTEKIGGSETVKVGDTTSLDVVGTDLEKVGSLRLTIAGGITPPDPLASLKSAIPAKPDPKALAQQVAGGTSPAAALKSAIPSPDALKSAAQNALKPPTLDSLLSGQITRSVVQMHQKKVGAAMIALAGGGITIAATKLLAEVIGGARILVAAKEFINANSSGKFVRAVGGMITRKAGKDITTSAHDAQVTIGGNASFTARDKVELRGQKIEITALRSVHLEKAGLTIDMTPAKIVIGGDLKLKSKDKVNVQGTPDNVSQ